MEEKPGTDIPTTSENLFSWRQILLYTGLFLGVVIVFQRSQRYVCDNLVSFDCPYYWPVSIFQFKFPTIRDLAIAASVTAAIFLFCKVLEKKRYSLWLSIAMGIVLIAGTTFIQGVDEGFYAPIAGDARDSVLKPYSLEGQEYFHDALQIKDPVDFFKRYNEIQPTLHSHAHTHPPGAVLTFYFLEKILRDPAIIALFIMLIAAPVTAYFFYRLLSTAVKPEVAGYMSFLLLLLPAIQIYFLATLDALVVSLLTATLYFFCFGKGPRSVAGALVLLVSSLMLTFVSIFILPVLAGYDLVVRRSIKRSAILIGGIACVYTLIYLTTGYDAYHSFRAASLYENPKGFMLFVDPVNYVFTRIEDVSEILFFLGPFLLVLVVRGVRKLDLHPLKVLTVLACLSVLGMYAVGAWRTGETARACAFIYPYLLFPVGLHLDREDVGARNRYVLAALVFLQTVGMQTFGTYYW